MVISYIPNLRRIHETLRAIWSNIVFLPYIGNKLLVYRIGFVETSSNFSVHGTWFHLIAHFLWLVSSRNSVVKHKKVGWNDPIRRAERGLWKLFSLSAINSSFSLAFFDIVLFIYISPARSDLNRIAFVLNCATELVATTAHHRSTDRKVIWFIVSCRSTRLMSATKFIFFATKIN